MKPFLGFDRSREGEFTLLPRAFFTQLLPAIDDLAELKVTLYALWLLGGLQPSPARSQTRARVRPGRSPHTGVARAVSWDELLGSAPLLSSLSASGGTGRAAEDVLKEGLERAVARGTLLRVSAGGQSWYLLNDADSRQAVKKIAQGDLSVGGIQQPVEVERPNIFSLYEQNIGLLQPLIAEELREAERLYPREWIEEAFVIAAQRNVRRWRYIQRILERWAQEGKGDRAAEPGSQEARYRYIRGKYAEYIKHR